MIGLRRLALAASAIPATCWSAPTWLSVVACLTMVSAPALPHQHQRWITTYASSPVGVLDAVTIAQIRAAFPAWASPDRVWLQGTIRYRLRIAQGGGILRLTLANPYAQPVAIKKISVGIAGEGLDAVPGSIREVHFNGNIGLSLPPSTLMSSDPIDLMAGDGADLVVSIYVADRISHWDGMTPPDKSTAIATGSDHSASERFPVSAYINQRPLIARIDVSRTDARRVVVAFGDSITDGVITANGDRGWAGVLARRLAASDLSVVNAGIGGNRLLRPAGTWQLAALERLERDIFSTPGVTHVISLLGINDIGMSGLDYPGFGASPPVRSDEIIAAFQQIIDEAHRRDIKVIGATILPFKGARYFSHEKEAIRQEVNAWIRSANAFDAVLDFDAYLRDPDAPDRLNPAFDSGDHLHPNAAGHVAMGEKIDLRLFDCKQSGERPTRHWPPHCPCQYKNH